MAYTNPMKIANGLALDFSVEAAGGSDTFLMKAADGSVTEMSSVPASRVSSGGNLTEVTSTVLTITGGTGSVLSNISILVKQAGASEAGYLSSTDWNTFNNKLSPSLANGYILIGDGTAQAVNTGALGDIGATVAGGLAIKSSVISNTHILSNAAIARTKFASGTAYRILVNNSGGVMSENSALTATRIIVADSNGQLTSSAATNTHATYISTLTADAQVQMNTKITGQATNALVQAPTITQHGYAITWDNSAQEWALTDPVVQGIPVAGSTNQVLMKVSGSDYDAAWTSLLLSHVTNVTSSAADVNVLLGADGNGVTPSIISYFGGATPLTSSVQQQLNSKLSNSLSPGAMYYGSGAGVASQLSPSTDGWVLTMVSGFPQWQVVVGTGTVTSIDVSGGTTGLTFSGGPITTTGTITMAGTLDANNGGTGFSAYTIGDLLYANSTSTLIKLGIGADGEVLTLAGGVPTWAAGGGGVADGDYGDIVVSGTGLVWTIKAALNKAWTGTHSFLDNSWTLLDNVDNTKILAFQLSGISAGTTRTLSVPDLSGTIALIGGSGNGAALTKTDDTNVTLTLGGTPASALLTATSITVAWSGQLAVTRGGTGLSSTTQGDILYADASNSLVTLPKSASATRYLSNTGSSNNPAWAQVDLTNGVTGILPIANGGSGGTVGAWLLSGTSTLTGAATITSNTANQHVFTGTWTATANNQYHWLISGALTARATSSDNIIGLNIAQSFTSGATNQQLVAVAIDPTFTNEFTHSGAQIDYLRLGSASDGTIIRRLGNSLNRGLEFETKANWQVAAYNFSANSNNTTSGHTGAFRWTGTYVPGGGTFTYVVHNVAYTYTFASGTHIAIGWNYDPSITNATGLATHLAYRATSGKFLQGGTTITAGSVLMDLQSTTEALLLTRVTTIASVTTPVNGMLAYDASTNLFKFRENGAWVGLGAGATLTGSANEVLKYSSSISGIGTKVFSASNGDLTLGDSGLAGSARSIVADGSSGNVGISITAKAAGALSLTGGSFVFNDNDETAQSLRMAITSTVLGFGSIKLAPSTLPLYLHGSDGISGSVNGADILIRAGAGFSGSNGNGGHIYLWQGIKDNSGIDGNIGLFTDSVSDWQDMERGLFIANALTIPTGDPTGGGFLFVESGALKYRGPSGTVTPIAAA